MLEQQGEQTTTNKNRQRRILMLIDCNCIVLHRPDECCPQRNRMSVMRTIQMYHCCFFVRHAPIDRVGRGEYVLKRYHDFCRIGMFSILENLKKLSLQTRQSNRFSILIPAIFGFIKSRKCVCLPDYYLQKFFHPSIVPKKDWLRIHPMWGECVLPADYAAATKTKSVRYS